MSLATQLQTALKHHSFSDEACERLQKLSQLSPLYTQFLKKNPAFWVWLESDENLNKRFYLSTFESQWNAFKLQYSDLDVLQSLRRFRRLMSLRIAYREINLIEPIDVSLEELSLLATFCLKIVCEHHESLLKDQYGMPVAENKVPIVYTILALGKLGGNELNFCSDIDLIYVYSCNGNCLKNDQFTNWDARNWFTTFFQKVTTSLQEQTEEGFLYHVDLRLRPQGSSAPIVHDCSQIEQYYSASGQTWERLALLKARPVAGDEGFGNELLEVLQPFRYPRSMQAHFIDEISLVKAKIEAEEAIHDIESNIKKGPGGIREVEFVVQALQLLHGGKMPFLQTTSTLEALNKLKTYELLPTEAFNTLSEGYLLLRSLENKIQMQEEQQTHVLPGEMQTIWHCMPEGLNDNVLKDYRNQIHLYYKDMFPESKWATYSKMWLSFLHNKILDPELKHLFENWFKNVPEETERFHGFISKGSAGAISLEFVRWLQSFTERFDDLVPVLITPIDTLERVGCFADSYGSRKQFFKACSLNPTLLEALCYLFDRSMYAFQLLIKHPEIMEELMYEANRKLKTPQEVSEELDRLPEGQDNLVWLYVKTEQIRIILSQVLWRATPSHIEKGLSDLAEGSFLWLLNKVDPEKDLTVLALGKWGHQSLSLGSDLDVIFFAEKSTTVHHDKVVRVLQVLKKDFGFSTIWDLDLRLRPYGDDGPLVVTLDAFGDYHATKARLWEKQLLLQARVIPRNEKLDMNLKAIIDTLLFTEPITQDDIRAIWDMRMRIEKEKTAGDSTFFDFKAGQGGLLDIYFFVQAMQLHLGVDHPSLRSGSIPFLIMELFSMDVIKQPEASRFIKHYNYLRKIEHALRFLKGGPVNRVSENNLFISKVMGYRSPEDFWKDHKIRLSGMRHAVRGCLSRQNA